MKLFKMTLYKLKMMLGDKVFFTAMIVLPLVISFIAGYALRYEKLNIIPVAVVDEDGTGCSELLLDRLSQKEGLRIHNASRKEALRILEANKVEQVFIIREGFEEKTNRGESSEVIDFIKSPSSFTSDYVSEVFAAEVMRLTANNLAADWVLKQYVNLGAAVREGLREEVISYADSQWEPEPLMTVKYLEMRGNRAEDVENSFRTASATSTGIIIFFIMLYILFGSGWLIEERINGTIQRLAAAPGALAYSYWSNVAALMVSAVFQVALLLAINRFVFGVNIFSGVRAYLIVLVYILSVVSISMFLSSTLKTPAQLQAGAPAFALLTGFAGGCFWNFVDVPERLKQLSRATPQGWALEGINKLMAGSGGIKHESYMEFILPVIVLFVIALILLPLSYIIICNKAKN